MTEPTTAPTAARPRRRRWFSFSLRSLIVFVTLAAIGIGWVASERAQSRRELEIAERLEGDGAADVWFAGPSDAVGSPFDPPEKESWWCGGCCETSLDRESAM